MNMSMHDGIDRSNKEDKHERRVHSNLESLIKEVNEMASVTGRDMTTECVMKLLDR